MKDTTKATYFMGKKGPRFGILGSPDLAIGDKGNISS